MEIILIIIGGILVWFLSDYFKLKHSIKDKGGMREKYSFLVNSMLTGYKSKIHQETDFSIVIGSSDWQGKLYFVITETLGPKLIVKWNMDILGFGKHEMEWTFSAYTTPHLEQQTEMMEKIKSDLEDYYAQHNLNDDNETMKKAVFKKLEDYTKE